MKQPYRSLLLAACLLATAAHAQNRPLTGEMAHSPAALGQRGLVVVPAQAAGVTVQAVEDSGHVAASASTADARTRMEAIHRGDEATSPAVVVQAPAAQRAAVNVSAVVHPQAERTGQVTRSLLAAQATGALNGRNVAGQALPALGATAGLTWQRYVDSFTHPIPEWFEEKVEDNSSN
ncbi:DUF3613 domain-containing protein [Kerstersia similis]|uniref:DUF3613 domain-containing protein n=1 Tax=Kerstersia similis TaxID=206505 RepID=UPI0039F14C82